jgi:hypothetical protein
MSNTWKWTHGNGHLERNNWKLIHEHGHMDITMNMDMSMDPWTLTHGIKTWTWKDGHGHIDMDMNMDMSIDP